MIVKTLSEHINMVILHFWAKYVVFEQKYFHHSKLPVFHRNNSNGYRKHSLKIWVIVKLPVLHFCWYKGFCHRTDSYLFLFSLDLNIFLDITGSGSFNYKEIRVSGAKRFRSIFGGYFLIRLIFQIKGQYKVCCKMKAFGSHPWSNILSFYS